MGNVGGGGGNESKFENHRKNIPKNRSKKSRKSGKYQAENEREN